MLELNDLTLDPKRAEEGEWKEFRGAQLLIASTDSPRYKGVMAQLARKHKLDLEDDNPKFADVIQDLTCEALAEAVLLDWKDLAISGKPIPYAKNVAKQILLSAPAVRTFVEEVAGRASNFNVQAVEAAKKP